MILRLLTNARGDLVWAIRVISYIWQHPLAATIIAALLAAIATFINWIVTTGGAGFEKNSFGAPISRTLWDWGDLLLIPIVLAAGAVVFNHISNQRSVNEQETDRMIALERSRDLILRHYLDIMQELILSKELRHGSEDNLRQVAGARTITTVRTLDARRFNQVVNFLKNAGLLDVLEDQEGDESVSHPKPAVTFERADLTQARWPGANLSRVVLDHVDLDRSDLAGAYMERSKLTGANLGSAILKGADLTGADLTAANLEDADMSFAYLENINLTGARLEGANFERADLSGAIFRNAVGLSDRQLNSADSIAAITMPDGTEVPDIPAKGEAETQYRIIESNGNWAYEIVKRWWQS